MRFVIVSEKGKKYSDEQLISDLKKAAHEPGRASIKMTEYDARGKYGSHTIARRFGGWNKALEKAGLMVKYHHNTSSRQFISELKRVAKILGKESVSKREYDKMGKYSRNSISERFGSWNKALEKAGLEVKKVHKISIEVLFENLEQVWLKLGRQPSRRDMKAPLSKYSEGPYRTTFGSWQNALNRFMETVNLKEIKSKAATTGAEAESQKKDG